MDKEKSRKKNQLLTEAAEMFDLPADVLAGLPHVELVGNRQFYMERHRGIISYSDTTIDINGDQLLIRVHGQGLALVSMTDNALRIKGEIARIEWVV